YVRTYQDGSLKRTNDLRSRSTTTWSGEAGPFDAIPSHGVAPGRHTVRVEAQDGLGNVAGQSVSFDVIAQPGPAIVSIAGDLAEAGVDDSGRDLFGMTFEVRNRGAGLEHVDVVVDGELRERFTGEDCAPTCSAIVDEFYL